MLDRFYRLGDIAWPVPKLKYLFESHSWSSLVGLIKMKGNLPGLVIGEPMKEVTLLTIGAM